MNETLSQTKILFQDESLCVLAKPAGITVNRSATTIHEVTLQDFIDANVVLEINASEDAVDFRTRSGIVHRLDKETSGILLVAKTFDAFIHLQAQFKSRSVQKKYIALVHGRMPELDGEINMPVGRLPWNTKHFGIVPGGKESLTFYHVIRTYAWLKKEVLSLVQLMPKTGRTHQIRVHLKYLNRPIFSDYLYAGRKVSALDRRHLSRVFLHASDISFHHPVTNELLTFTCSLPEELQSFIDKLEPSV